MKIWELYDDQSNEEIEALVEQFTAGADLSYDQRLADYDIYGSIAHVKALQRLEILTDSESSELTSELINLLDEQLQLTPEDEDIHTKVENEITKRLGKLGKKLHTGRSRNDQILVDLRLYTKDSLFEISKRLLTLIESLISFATREKKTPMVGYTHSRKAMPSSVGLWAGSFVEAFLDDLSMLESSFELLDQNPLGAGAGYGVPLNLDRKLTAKLLGFSKVQNNPLYVINSRGKFEFNLVCGLASLQLELSRLASDLILFTGEELNYFELPEPFTTGSSIMPQKKNPDVLELIRGKSSAFCGHITSLFTLLHGLRSGYNRDQQETKKHLFEALESSSDSLAVLSPLISGLEVHENCLLSQFTQEVLSVDEVLKMVNNGKAFRKAYREVKKDLSRKNKKDSVSEEQVKEAINKREFTGEKGGLNLEKAEADLKTEKQKWKRKKQKFSQGLEQLLGAGQ